jgi:hypothetical protein
MSWAAPCRPPYSGKSQFDRLDGLARQGERKRRLFYLNQAITSPAKSRIFKPAQDVKVFCFFSSEKKILLLSSEKEAKRLLRLGPRIDTGLGR